MKRLSEAAEFWIADCGGNAARALADVRATKAMLYARSARRYGRLEAELEAYLRGELEPWVDPRGTDGE